MKEGDRFEGYLLKNKLGEGGMAEVFRAERIAERGVTRDVCVKRILPALSADAAFVEMFIDEARIASTLRHGNIVAVEHFGRHEGVPFMVMTWVNGVDAARLLRHLRTQHLHVPVDAVLYIIDEVLRALEYAHAKRDPFGRPLQIVHRDVSPHNILISFSGEVLLSDFGIAKATSRLYQTHGHVVKGKIAYMAPEQAVGSPLDHRADLFAVGVVAFQLLTGALPFGDGHDPVATTQALITGNRSRIRDLRPEVPAGVEALVDRLLMPFANDRYPDAVAARDALAAARVSLSGERSLKQLLKSIVSEDAFSTISPVMKYSPPSDVTAVDAQPFRAFDAHVFDATLAANPTDHVSDDAVTRVLAGPTRRDALAVPMPRAQAPTVAPDAGTRTESAGDGATGPFVAVSVVPSRPRSKRLVASVAAVSIAVVLAGVYIAAGLSDSGAHATAAPPIVSAPGPSRPAPAAPSAPSLVMPDRARGDALGLLDAGATTDASAAQPAAMGSVRIIAEPWGTISVDGAPPRDSGATLLLPVGRHRIRAVIQSRVIVTRTVTVRAGTNPTVRMEPPADYAM